MKLFRENNPSWKGGISLNKEKYRKEYYEKNKEEIKRKARKYGKEYYKEHKEIRKKYRLTPKAKYYEYRLSASRRGYKWNLTFEEFMTFWQKPCSYCGNKIKTIGIDRVNNKRGYFLKNVVSCCHLCNYIKNDLSKGEFIAHCKKVVNYNSRL